MTEKRKAYELTLTAKRNSGFKKEKLNDSGKMYNYIKQFYFDDINVFESAFVILLNKNLQSIGYAKIATGGVTECAMDVRIIAKFAVESLATAVIIAHNHPSGSLTPSRDDDGVTYQIKKGLDTLRIHLLDHIIITEDDYYSYRENGRI